jgi:DNA primase
MAFPPQFLDEIRARVALAGVIGRRLKLTRKGREFSGLCPFHNEKTPSFTVNEEKGFFHCFGCGAHGDVIGFVMRADNLSFPEAVERLAGEAGIEVPVASPEERRQAKRQATLLDAVEAACVFFERRLGSAEGRSALDYLHGRGLDDATIARFRLGFAPDARSALKSALTGETLTEPLLVEAGLLIRPEDGGAAYDRFRGRITFPIADRRGRVIAFGARALADVQPKYLNSPDTPLFHKGHVLYGLATAAPAARARGRVIVCEGYMDVIALQRAGFPEAVAPLGTALTEAQIELLWRMAPEPVLCFDGDSAGQRAAARAAERALPLLKPGLSLSFVALPPGEDPDSLIAARGPEAMEALLGNATALVELIWQMETAGRRIDTPERRAGLEQSLEARARTVNDPKVQYRYLAEFRRRLGTATGDGPAQRNGKDTARLAGWRDWGGKRRYGRDGRFAPDRATLSAAPADAWRAGFERLRLLDARILLAVAVNHPEILDERAEVLGALEFSDRSLDKLRQEILLLYGSAPDLEIEALRCQLMDRGCADALAAVLATDVTVHAGFARSETGRNAAVAGFDQVVHWLREPERRAHLAEAERAYAEDPTEENWTRLRTSMLSAQHQPSSEDDGAPGAGSRAAAKDVKILSSLDNG